MLRYRRKRRWKEEGETVGRSEGFTTIARVLKSDKRAEKFCVRARVVGTFPLRLEDCVVRCCKNCSEQWAFFFLRIATANAEVRAQAVSKHRQLRAMP